MGLTKRAKCSKRCELARDGKACSCPKTRAFYVEFYVHKDGNILKLSKRGEANAKMKRWKVVCTNKAVAQDHEAIIKKQLREGLPDKRTPQPVPMPMHEYAMKWLEQAKATLAPKTHNNYAQILSLSISFLSWERSRLRL